jgi:hypothetical protein
MEIELLPVALALSPMAMAKSLFALVLGPA